MRADAQGEQGIGRTLIAYAALGVLILFLLPLSPFIAFAILWANFQDRRLVRRFRRQWPGRQGLLVYSGSPHWQAFIESRWLPLLGDRLAVVNWSERATWASRHPLEKRLFERFAGSREFNPVAIILGPAGEPQGPPDGHPDGDQGELPVRAIRWAGERMLFREREVRVVRFWRAFRDHKHGRAARLRAAERELFDTIGVSPPTPFPEPRLPGAGVDA